MNPYLQKFNDVKIEYTVLNPVKDIIYEQYNILCHDEIKNFNDNHFMCNMCCVWCPNSHNARFDVCADCAEKYIVWKCQNCEHVFEDCVMVVKSIHEAYCTFCYEYEINHTCLCGVQYKLNKGFDEKYCSSICSELYNI